MGESRVLKKEAGDKLSVGAAQANDSMVDGVREVKRGGLAPVR
jgi:hypothetical protein